MSIPESLLTGDSEPIGVVVLLCGIPGAGKSSFASRFVKEYDSARIEYQKMFQTESVQAEINIKNENFKPSEILSFDSFLPDERHWDADSFKNSRVAALNRLQMILSSSMPYNNQLTHATGTKTADYKMSAATSVIHHRAIVVDDYMHLASMRHTVYKLCRDASAGFGYDRPSVSGSAVPLVLIWVDCPLSLALHRNARRNSHTSINDNPADSYLSTKSFLNTENDIIKGSSQEGEVLEPSKPLSDRDASTHFPRLHRSEQSHRVDPATIRKIYDAFEEPHIGRIADRWYYHYRSYVGFKDTEGDRSCEEEWSDKECTAEPVSDLQMQHCTQFVHAILDGSIIPVSDVEPCPEPVPLPDWWLGKHGFWEGRLRARQQEIQVQRDILLEQKQLEGTYSLLLQQCGTAHTSHLSVAPSTGVVHSVDAVLRRAISAAVKAISSLPDGPPAMNSFTAEDHSRISQAEVSKLLAKAKAETLTQHKTASMVKPAYADKSATDTVVNTRPDALSRVDAVCGVEDWQSLGRVDCRTSPWSAFTAFIACTEAAMKDFCIKAAEDHRQQTLIAATEIGKSVSIKRFAVKDVLQAVRTAVIDAQRYSAILI